MLLSGLTEHLRQTEAYQALLKQIKGQQRFMQFPVIRAARPFVLSTLAHDWDGPIIFITGQIKRAYNIVEQLPVWITQTRPILRYAEPASSFYERAPWGSSVIHSRIEALAALLYDDNPIIVTSARALMQRTIPVNTFRQHTLLLQTGERYALNNLLETLLSLGYEPASIVVEPGTFSRRGGVIDIYPVNQAEPVRVDFFDDEIDSLRLFDPATQRSHTAIDNVRITPAREALPKLTPPIAEHLKSWFATLPPTEDDMTTPMSDFEPLQAGRSFANLEYYLPYLYPQPVSLLDYASTNALIVIEDWENLQETVQDIERHTQQNHSFHPPDYPQPYITWDILNMMLEEHTRLELTSQSGVFSPGSRFGGQLRSMLNTVRELRNKGGRILIISEQAERLKKLWIDQDASEFIPTQQNIEQPLARHTLYFVNGTMQEGWNLSTSTGYLHVFTEAEIFGWDRPEPRRRKLTRRQRTPETAYSDWKEGDFVVHVDYGIGRFGGLKHRTVDGNEREYLLIHYGDNDMLFVPIHQADRLTRYVGADDTPPALHRLGKPDWLRVRNRVQKAVEEEAHDLLALYAKRIHSTGFAFSPDNHWQHELEASFPYVETEDQLRSLREVKADMEAAHPMDRLICGDVGYGKTEVALRAAFKAVNDGKQVAVLVPTTVLAQQHYETFTNRLVNFPLKIAVMSRFRSKEEQSRLLPKVASGEIDILIGTHRILSQDVTFKDLGLVIIDEEQRFGVKHKEHFKRLRTEVDVLTLTATPIPRTLHMSLTGVRDISMIQTPPEERLPVITHVGRFDEKLIRQAILRELERGGQVFIVHNRIKTIESLAEKIQELVPEARIVIGHGQMGERELERVMSDFAHGKHDILLSTTIIESGIDIPNANTLIVDHADHLGLAQLYQLRGRVGRGAQQGYAYFFHPRKLTEEAKARLETLAENTSLGAGFQIAMRDLEIRGAGDILSTRQTGHVSAIGLHLYTQLLSEAVSRLKGEQPSHPTTQQGIVIDLPIPSYIPTDWIPDMAMRLQIYRRIGGLTDQNKIEAMRRELVDRFGSLPGAVAGLLYQIEVKLLAQAANATHIIARNKQVQIKLPYLGEVNRGALEHQLGEDIQVSRTAIQFQRDDEGIWQLRLLEVLQYLAESIQQLENEQGI